MLATDFRHRRRNRWDRAPDVDCRQVWILWECRCQQKRHAADSIYKPSRQYSDAAPAAAAAADDDDDDVADCGGKGSAGQSVSAVSPAVSVELASARNLHTDRKSIETHRVQTWRWGEWGSFYVPKKNPVVFFGYTHLKNPPQKTHTSTLT